MTVVANESQTSPSRPTVGPALVAIASWVLPGLGYILLKERARGITIMVAVLFLYLSGLLVAGVRVIDVPGYDKNGIQDRVNEQGQRVGLGSDGYDRGRSALFSGLFISEIAAKPWYVGQILAGPVNLLASSFSLHEARINTPMSHARVAEIGTLYTAVAGMLNLLAIIDAASRAADDQENGQEQVPA